MVKKLMKYELTYYFRSLGLFLPIFFVVGIMTRILLCFDSNDLIYTITTSMSALMLGMLSIGLLLFAFVIGIVRFYKNMYSAEGYLTFSLPVNNRTHIFVKLFAAVLNLVLCFLSVIAVFCIVLSGENLYLLISQLEDFVSLNGVGLLIAYIIEFVFVILTSAIGGMLLFYACITIGQTAKKNRILKAVGAYFIYYLATQIFSTIVMVIFAVLTVSGALDSLMEWVINYPHHVTLTLYGVIIAINAILSVAFWIVTEKIMTKKLNLE